MDNMNEPVEEDLDYEDVNWGDEDAQISFATQPIEESSSNNIRVAVRVRPPNQRELSLNEDGICLSVPGLKPEDGIVTCEGSQDFSFDLAFPLSCTQLDVFLPIGINIVQCAHHGYNASLFAYGQTSSGKSFSMMGVNGTDQVGLIPRIARLLFNVIASNTERVAHVEASYMEIYNEKLRDLLNDNSSQKEDLRVRENKQLGVHVSGLTREIVQSEDEILSAIDKGTTHRTTAATLYNSESSRSHAVFEITVQSKYNDPITKADMRSSSRIALIDLAGSERSAKVGSTGQAFKEGNNINKSLTVLGRCIRALVDESKGKKVSVPFRESVLTWYLRDSLSGNARTTMLATCSPVESNIEETLSTLRYAASAKNIKTSAKKNEDPAQAKIRELSSELEQLRQRLEQAEEFNSNNNNGGNDDRQGVNGTGMKSDDPLYGLSEKEKKMLLNELSKQMGTLVELSNETKNSVKRTKKMVKKKLVTTFPVLSCVSKDELLNHTLKIKIANIRPFTIGRILDDDDENNDNDENSNQVRNNFELEGLGIKTRHCAFVPYEEAEVEVDLDGEVSMDSPMKGNVPIDGDMSTCNELPPDASIASNKVCSSDKNKVGLRTLTHDAEVYVNGIPIKENETIKLKHLDRIVLGPCRLVALFITKPLMLKERELWQYESCLEEMSHLKQLVQSKYLNGHISPTRKLINQQIKEIKDEQLAQANLIALEMSSPFRFECRSMVVRGCQGLDSPLLTVDDFLENNEPRLLVTCVVDKNVDDDPSMLSLPQTKVYTASEILKSFEMKQQEENEETESLSSKSTAIVENQNSSVNEAEYVNNNVLFDISLEKFQTLLTSLSSVRKSNNMISHDIIRDNESANDGEVKDIINIKCFRFNNCIKPYVSDLELFRRYGGEVGQACLNKTTIDNLVDSHDDSENKINMADISKLREEYEVLIQNRELEHKNELDNLKQEYEQKRINEIEKLKNNFELESLKIKSENETIISEMKFEIASKQNKLEEMEESLENITKVKDSEINYSEIEKENFEKIKEEMNIENLNLRASFSTEINLKDEIISQLKLDIVQKEERIALIQCEYLEKECEAENQKKIENIKQEENNQIVINDNAKHDNIKIMKYENDISNANLQAQMARNELEIKSFEIKDLKESVIKQAAKFKTELDLLNIKNEKANKEVEMKTRELKAYDSIINKMKSDMVLSMSEIKKKAKKEIEEAETISHELIMQTKLNTKNKLLLKEEELGKMKLKLKSVELERDLALNQLMESKEKHNLANKNDIGTTSGDVSKKDSKDNVEVSLNMDISNCSGASGSNIASNGEGGGLSSTHVIPYAGSEGEKKNDVTSSSDSGSYNIQDTTSIIEKNAVKKASDYHINEDGLFDDEDDAEEVGNIERGGLLRASFSMLQQGFETSVNVAEDITRMSLSMSRNDVTDPASSSVQSALPKKAPFTRRQSSLW